jgi:hypothetical protein
MTGFRSPGSLYISAIGRREREIIRAHAAEIADEPYNLCVEASTKLTNELRDNGIAAHLLHCKGLRTDAPNADARWHVLAPQSRWVHFLVQIGEDVVDLTRRQFFPASAFPFVQSMAATDAEWDSLTLSIAKPRLQLA